MMAPNERSELASSLHADDRWLRDLARRMLRDTSLADDAAQATWMSVLRSPPKGELSRGFLRTALRHVIAKLRRGDSRRDARERAVASAESIELGDVIEKMELRRVLLAAVLELEPIYRDVVLLRFHQDLTPTAIAVRTGIPLATVKTRLRRAEEQLTERLDRRAGGDRRRYLAAFVATAEPTLRGAITTLIHGGIVMAMKQKLVGVAVAALVIVGGFALFERGGEHETSADRRGKVDAPSVPIVRPEVGSASSSESEVDRVAEIPSRASPTKTETQGTLDDTRVVAGFVLDVAGRVVPFAEVAFEITVPRIRESEIRGTPRPTAMADGEGRFEITVPAEEEGRLVGAAARFATVYSGVVRRAPHPVPPVVILAPGVALAGEVVDIDGRPIAGADVAIFYLPTLQSRFPLPLENAFAHEPRLRTDASGRFAFERLVPVFDDARFSALAPRYLSYSAPVPATDDLEARIVLERPAPHAENRVRGQVIDALGMPVPKADVILGHSADITDERGLFDLDATRAGIATVIRAAARGFQGAALNWPLDPPTDFVSLALGPPAKSIRGIVRSSRGEAVSDALVMPFDGTPLGFVADTGILMTAESRCGGYEQGVDTGSSGEFELGGLEDRNYVLRVFLRKSGASFVTPSIAAGSVNVTIDVPTDLTIPELRGRIVDRSGIPMAGIAVSICATQWQCSYLGSSFLATSGSISTATSDEAGRFKLNAVPRTHADINVEGDSIVGRSLAIPTDVSSELEIVVERRRFLRIELASGEMYQQFSVVDDRGEKILMRQEEEGGVVVSSTMTLTDGRSPVTIVPESARFVVLKAADGKERRVEIEFAKDGVTVVR